MRRKRLFFIIIVVLVAISAGLFTIYRLEEVREFLSLGKGEESAPATPSRMAGGARAVIVIPSEKGLITREIALKEGLLPVERAEAVIGEYLKGLGAGLRETRLLGVYRDKGNVLYIDLSGDISQDFSGDAMDEYLLLKSLWQTVSRNFPWVADVRLLIDGKEKESIGGHLTALGGLRGTVTRGEQQ